MLKKTKILVIGLGLIACFMGVSSSVSLAAVCDLTAAPATNDNNQPIACDCPSGLVHPKDSSGAKIVNTCASQKNAVDCASGKLDPNDKTKCAPLGDGCPKGTSTEACLKTNPLVVNLNNIIKFLSAGVGIVIIGAIIVGGIQYSLAGGNETAIAAAKQRIINALIALAAFLFTFSLLEWLIPGGL